MLNKVLTNDLKVTITVDKPISYGYICKLCECQEQRRQIMNIKSCLLLT